MGVSSPARLKVIAKLKAENDLEKEVKEWIVQKDRLSATKAAELKLRKKICEHILSGKIKGAKKGVIGPYILTATAKLNNKIDKDALKGIWKDLNKTEMACVKFDPKLVAKEYKTLGSKSILQQVITTKPSPPGLELKGIKN